MQSFDEFQRELEERASLINEPQGPAVLPPPEMTPLDQEMNTMCAAFSEADVRRSEQQAEATTSTTALAIVQKVPVFNPPPAVLKPVHETYNQLIHLSRDLNGQLAGLGWYSSRSFVQDIVDMVRCAYTSGKLGGFASDLVRVLDSLIAGCESFAYTGMQTRHDVVSQLFLLTAISAHELQMSLRHDFDC